MLIQDWFFAVAWFVFGTVAAGCSIRRFAPEFTAVRAGAVGCGALIAFLAVLLANGGDPPSESVAAPSAQTDPLGGSDVAVLRDVSAECARAGNVGTGGFGVLEGVGARLGGALKASAVVKANDDLRLNGWAGDASQAGPARAVCLVVDGRIETAAFAVYGAARPDVAAAVHNEALAPVAFMITVAVDRLGRGKHVIQAAAISKDGAVALLPNERTITVK